MCTEDLEFPRDHANDHLVLGCRCRQRARHRFHLVRLDVVADLATVEPLDTHAALEALANFLRVILEAPQARQEAIPNLHAIAHQADLALAIDDTLGNHATGNRAGLRYLEELANLGHTEQHFLLVGRQHALERGAYFFDRLVDDVVKANVHALAG